MGLPEIGCDGMDWIHLAQDRVQWQFLFNTGINLREFIGRFSHYHLLKEDPISCS
jgi:hypothetical protein